MTSTRTPSGQPDHCARGVLLDDVGDRGEARHVLGHRQRIGARRHELQAIDDLHPSAQRARDLGLQDGRRLAQVLEHARSLLGGQVQQK